MQVHKHNSLDHLAVPSSRPGSARPRSAGSSGNRRSRPASASARAPSRSSAKTPFSQRSASEKTELQKAIDGDTGPPMLGVSTYPYSRPQTAYMEDFQMLVASTITHPYLSTTAFNKGSAPHNLLTGHAPSARFGHARATDAETAPVAMQVPISRPRMTIGTVSISAPTRKRATGSPSTRRRWVCALKRCFSWGKHCRRLCERDTFFAAVERLRGRHDMAWHIIG